MTIPSYTASGSFILFIPGLLFLLYGAWQAIRQRQNARRLILWGAVHDAGLICMALGAANAAAGTGIWLFVAFQLLARGLSWSALNSLAGPAAPSATFAALRGAVKLQPVNGILFALGLMASVGGSPFLIPEGRLFITQGILASSLPLHCGLFCTVLAAVTATVLIALHVDALLCLVGFGVKAGLVPLHSWLPDAHPAAPSSVSGPLSGIITKMGMFGIVVLLLGQTNGALFAKAEVFGLSWFGSILTFMGAATLIFGELMALKQDDIKRMLAYSTLGQLGEIALVLGMGTWLATAGALSHMLSHAIMKDLLFLGAGALILRAGSR